MSLQLRWDHQYQFAGYYAAQWQGYYGAAGFDVEIRSAIAPGGVIRSATEEVASGRADFGVGAADVLIARDQGRPLVVLASILQHSAVAFYGREDRQLEDPADLLKLKVARNVNDLFDVELQAILLLEGIDPKRVIPYPHVPGIQHLVDGRVDVLPGYSTAAPFEFQAQGLRVKTLRPITYGIDFYGDSLFTDARLVDGDPDAVERFRGATVKGWELALDHPLEIADRITRELPRSVPVAGATLHDFNRFQIDGVKALAVYPVVSIGTVNPERWRRMHDLMSRLGLLRRRLDAVKAELVFNVDRLASQREARTERLAVLALLATGGAAALIYLWTVRLRRRVLEKTRDLRERDDRLRSLSAHIPGYLAYVNAQTLRYEYVNDAYAGSFGIPRDTIIGSTVADVVGERNYQFALPYIAEARQGRSTSYENAFHFKAGRRWLQVNYVPITDASGQVSSLAVLAFDLTDRKLAEDQLREGERRHRIILETAMDGYALLDPRGRLLEVNESYCRMTGYAAEDLLTMSISELEAAELAEETASHFSRIRECGRDRFETRHRRKDGALLDVEVGVQYQPIDAGRFVAFIRDITERKREEAERERLALERVQLEEQLRQSQKMEAIGRLAGGVAHDFNNLTAIVIGYGELLAGRLEPGDPRRELVEQIVAAGKRSAAVTRQLLAFSRKQTLQPTVLDLNALLRNFERLLGRLIGEHVELQLRLAEGLGCVTVDQVQVEQVVTNLALNARDAMPRGGRLLVETAAHEVDETSARGHGGASPGKYVRLTLTDTGCGMDEAGLARLFEPFYTTKDRARGTGLGLATAYGIVRQSGGYIWASSEPGRGASFSIIFPRTDAVPATKTRDTGGVAVRGAGERILLVEDEPALLELCEEVLSGLGYQVTQAGNGPEALALVERGLRPDLVITDVIMPGMSGAELAERLCADRPGLRVLYMSGYPEESVAPHGVLRPGTHLIQKPFARGAIALKVRQVLEAVPERA